MSKNKLTILICVCLAVLVFSYLSYEEKQTSIILESRQSDAGTEIEAKTEEKKEQEQNLATTNDKQGQVEEGTPSEEKLSNIDGQKVEELEVQNKDGAPSQDNQIKDKVTPSEEKVDSSRLTFSTRDEAIQYALSRFSAEEIAIYNKAAAKGLTPEQEAMAIQIAYSRFSTEEIAALEEVIK